MGNDLGEVLQQPLRRTETGHDKGQPSRLDYIKPDLDSVQMEIHARNCYCFVRQKQGGLVVVLSVLADCFHMASYSRLRYLRLELAPAVSSYKWSTSDHLCTINQCSWHSVQLLCCRNTKRKCVTTSRGS